MNPAEKHHYASIKLIAEKLLELIVKLLDLLSNYKGPEAPFMIFVEGGSSPTKRHITLASTEAEAKRLAGQNHGRKFWIMQPITAFKANAVVEVEV